MSLRFLKSKQNDKSLLCLDIGTEAVKALIFKKEQLAGKDNEKIIILGASQQYLEKSGVFDSRSFEKEILKKAISKAVKQAQNQAKIKNRLILLSLPATILKARIVFQFFERENAGKKISQAQEKIIYDQVLKNAQKKIFQKFAEEFGILPQDIQGFSLKVLRRKIDGYSVSSFQGYKGKILEFKILSVFLPKKYLEDIKKIIGDLGLEILKIVYFPENLSVIRKTEKDAIFLDIGGEITQIFLIKNSDLEQINEFKTGGKAFSQGLSDALGISEEIARDLKERYSNKLLSPETSERIKEILTGEQRDWHENLKSEIKKMKIKGLFPSTIFLFGGGSQLPEIQDSLKSLGKIKLIFPNDFKNIEYKTKSLKSPQDVPLLLTAYTDING